MANITSPVVIFVSHFDSALLFLFSRERGSQAVKVGAFLYVIWFPGVGCVAVVLDCRSWFGLVQKGLSSIIPIPLFFHPAE